MINKLKDLLATAVEVEERPPGWWKNGGFAISINVTGGNLELKRFDDKEDAEEYATFLRLAILELARDAVELERLSVSIKEVNYV